MKSLFIVLVILMLGTVACSNDDAVNALQQEIDSMKQEIKTLEADHAKQVSSNANKITALEVDNDQLKSSLEKLGTRDSRLSTQISNLENQPNLEECLRILFYAPRASADGNIPVNPYIRMTVPHGNPFNNIKGGADYFANMTPESADRGTSNVHRSFSYGRDNDWWYDPYHTHTIWNSTDKGNDKGLPPECKSP